LKETPKQVMAITKIHPIKSTLKLAIDYIANVEKTDKKILISTNKCYTTSVHTQFLRRRKEHNVRGSVSYSVVLAKRSYTSEMAHKIGLKLWNKILKDEYEFILSTHIDKGHIHNHIIFNNVDMVTGKCYQFNKRNYHQIRYQSDKLYKENALSVIHEYYERFKKKYKTNCKYWYENEQVKNGILGKASFSLTLTE